MTQITRAFFATSLVALLTAALLHLVFLAGLPAMWAAATHLTVFGWFTAMILAVNYHTMPVFSARDFPYPRLIQLHWAVFTSGILLATVGLAGFQRDLTSAGLTLQLAGACLFMANTVLLFRRGTPRLTRAPVPPIASQPEVDRLASLATRAAGVSLPLALLLLLGVYSRYIGAAWLLAAEHLATLGWMMLMIIGVAYHVLPRFSGRGVRGVGWARAQLVCYGGALTVMVTALGVGWPDMFAVGGVLMALAIVLFAWTIWPSIITLRPRQAQTQITFKRFTP